MDKTDYYNEFDAEPVSKDAFLNQSLPESNLHIEGVGVVRIRSLSRAIALRLQEQDSNVERERYALRHGLVSPSLTNTEIKQWQESAPAGFIEPITNAILKLSGMLEESEKEAVERFPDEPNA
jgi:hypothetical protein